MNQDPNSQSDIPFGSSQNDQAETVHTGFREVSQEGLSTFISQVFGWMFAALFLTSATSYIVLSNEALLNVAFKYMWPLIILELFAVGFLAIRVHKMSPITATVVFFAYAFCNGFTLTPLIAAYTGESIAGTFMITAGTFGCMSFYGMTTKKDLTSWGSLLLTALIGIIIAAVVNVFILQSSGFSLVISGIAILVFVGLIAYDTQMIKSTYQEGMERSAAGHNLAILAALNLYLDFVNLFIHLLQFFGDRE
ncbi:MAG: Bax inhibitor-1/YccA family protein [Candidatus Cloacimonetes bacterium]|nr:Bax inhibitor-1/YccA family protein [Candidatus Cloacimonadota bacterium]